jgi:hypothetical protein
VDVLNNTVLRLPVPPSRANFYGMGFSRAFFGKVRLEASLFRRDFRNYADDDVLLNTGVSFPISFSSARIRLGRSSRKSNTKLPIAISQTRIRQRVPPDPYRSPAGSIRIPFLC